MDGGTVAAIVVGIILAVGIVAIIVWLFSKKKNVKKVGKQGKRYTKQNKFSCILNPISLFGGKCLGTKTGGNYTSTSPNTPNTNNLNTLTTVSTNKLLNTQQIQSLKN